MVSHCVTSGGSPRVLVPPLVMLSLSLGKTARSLWQSDSLFIIRNTNSHTDGSLWELNDLVKASNIIHKQSRGYINEKYNTSGISTVGEERKEIQLNVPLTTSQDRILNWVLRVDEGESPSSVSYKGEHKYKVHSTNSGIDWGRYNSQQKNCDEERLGKDLDIMLSTLDFILQTVEAICRQ